MPLSNLDAVPITRVAAYALGTDGNLSLPVRRQLTLAIYALLFGEAASVGRVRGYVNSQCENLTIGG